MMIYIFNYISRLSHLRDYFHREWMVSKTPCHFVTVSMNRVSCTTLPYTFMCSRVGIHAEVWNKTKSLIIPIRPRDILARVSLNNKTYSPCIYYLVKVDILLLFQEGNKKKKIGVEVIPLYWHRIRKFTGSESKGIGLWQTNPNRHTHLSSEINSRKSYRLPKRGNKTHIYMYTTAAHMSVSWYVIYYVLTSIYVFTAIYIAESGITGK